MHLDKLRKISRERFWTYTVGPYLLGIAATGVLRDIKALGITSFSGAILLLLLLWYCCYFMFPANLLIYGVNDIADGDTDQFNEKKGTYEEKIEGSYHKELTKQIFLRNTFPHIIGLILGLAAAISSPQVLIGFVAFYFTSIFYSLPPIRAKARPFLDGGFNILYAIPGLIGFLLLGGTASEINWIAFIAGWLRCVAMHTYSAIPDIEPDKQAGIQTTATTLGEKKTLIYCLIVWLISGLLLYIGASSLFPFILVALSAYIILILSSFKHPVFRIYKLFPRVNGILGFILFRIITAQFVL